MELTVAGWFDKLLGGVLGIVKAGIVIVLLNMVLSGILETQSDYVVAAFNSDKPYNRFIAEQLAGDLLPDDDPSSSAERLTATGFLCIGPKMLAEDDPVKMQMDIIDEQVDTIGRAFMGLTLGCARCHHHKFDPVPTQDYYRIRAAFEGIEHGRRVIATKDQRRVHGIPICATIPVDGPRSSAGQSPGRRKSRLGRADRRR